MNKLCELEEVRTYSKQLHTILVDKYKNSDLNKLMKNKFQNLTEELRNELFKLLQKFEEFFNGTLGTWKTYTVYL